VAGFDVAAGAGEEVAEEALDVLSPGVEDALVSAEVDAVPDSEAGALLLPA
jgi:hypothetical protein